jgi:hypothetical protein
MDGTKATYSLFVCFCCNKFIILIIQTINSVRIAMWLVVNLLAAALGFEPLFFSRLVLLPVISHKNHALFYFSSETQQDCWSVAPRAHN